MGSGGPEKWVVLDTNCLLAPYNLGIDVVEGIRDLFPDREVVTITGVLEELERIRRRGVHGRLGVRLAKKYMEKKGIRVIERGGNVDDVLVELAKEGAVICTNDRELKKRIKSVGGQIVFVRKYRKVETW